MLLVSETRGRRASAVIIEGRARGRGARAGHAMENSCTGNGGLAIQDWILASESQRRNMQT